MDIDAAALEIDKIGSFVHEDPYMLLMAAEDRSRLILGHNDAISDIKDIISKLDVFGLCRLDRIVFDNATGQ